MFSFVGEEKKKRKEISVALLRATSKILDLWKGLKKGSGKREGGKEKEEEKRTVTRHQKQRSFAREIFLELR